MQHLCVSQGPTTFSYWCQYCAGLIYSWWPACCSFYPLKILAEARTCSAFAYCLTMYSGNHDGNGTSFFCTLFILKKTVWAAEVELWCIEFLQIFQVLVAVVSGSAPPHQLWWSAGILPNDSNFFSHTIPMCNLVHDCWMLLVDATIFFIMNYVHSTSSLGYFNWEFFCRKSYWLTIYIVFLFCLFILYFCVWLPALQTGCICMWDTLTF